MKRSLVVVLLIFVAAGFLQAQTGHSMLLGGNSTGQYYRVPDDPSLRMVNNYTLEAWIYPTGFTSLGGIISKYNLNWQNRSYVLRYTSTGNCRGFNFDSMYTADNIISPNQWYHVVALNDNGTRRLYLNGVQQTLYGSPHDIVAGTSDLAIGRDWIETNQRCFQGMIDNVRIWNIALSESQVQQVRFSWETPWDSNRVLHYTCEGPWTNNFFDDISSNYNTGSFFNGGSKTNQGFWVLRGLGSASYPYLMECREDIWALSNNLNLWGSRFQQTADITFSVADFQSGGAYYDGGNGWNPIGNANTAFTGVYQGQGYSISGIYSYRPNADNGGFFGAVSSANITALNLTNVEITGDRTCGGLLGISYGGLTVTNCHVTGNVYAIAESQAYYTGTGGLAGVISHSVGTISGSSFTGNVYGYYHVGGLVGMLNDANTVSECYSGGTVTFRSANGARYIGGLIGVAEDASGGVSPQNAIVVTRCYSTSDVFGNPAASTTSGDVGGLIGAVSNNQTVTDCYALGNVNGPQAGTATSFGTGGFIGRVGSSPTIARCYSAGSVTGSPSANQIGGFIGASTTSTTGCFWDMDSSGQTGSAGNATGLTHAQTINHTAYVNAGWNIPTVWHVDDASDTPANAGRPTLAWQGYPHTYGGAMTTGVVTEYESSHAELWGSIDDLGSMNISGYGFCLSTSNPPTVGNLVVDLGVTTLTGEFTYMINTLDPATLYYVRTFMRDHNTIVYGNTTSFTTLEGANPIPPAGAGINGDPYRIATLGNLLWVAVQVNNGVWGMSNNIYFSQTANINASETRQWFDGTGFPKIGDGSDTNPTSRFYGNYNGNGMTIDSLYVNRAGHGGLFGYVEGGSVTNVRLTNAEIHGGDRTGGLVGCLRAATILDCSVTGEVYGGMDTGGLVGNTRFGTIRKCYSRARVEACFSETASLVGRVAGGTIDQCYTTGQVWICGTMNYLTRGFVGVTDSYPGWPTPVFTRNLLDAEASLQTSGIGATAKTTAQMTDRNTFRLEGWDIDGVWLLNSSINNGYPYLTYVSLPSVSTQTVTNLGTTGATMNGNLTGTGTPAPTQHGFCWAVTPYPSVTDNVVNLGPISANASFSHTLTGLIPMTGYYYRAYAQSANGVAYGGQSFFSTLDEIPTGSGTAQDPYQVNNASDLAWIARNHGTLGANTYYQVVTDFSASETSTWYDGAGLEPIGTSTTPFCGHFDGAGYTISGLRINRPTSDNIGLFGYTDHAVIGRVNLTTFDIVGNTNVGALVGMNAENSTVWNCHVSGQLTSGLALPPNTYPPWEGSFAVGGLVGRNEAYIDNCGSAGNVYAYAEAGGLVGYNTGEINNSYSRSYVERRWWNAYRYHDNFGGLVGTNTGYVSFSYSTCQVFYANVNQNTVDYPQGLQTDNGLVGVALPGGRLLRNFFDATTSAATSSGWNDDNHSEAPQPLTTTQLKTQAVLQAANWNFYGLWSIVSGVNDGYPYQNTAPVPVVHGKPATSIDYNSATFNANLVTTGSATPEAYGFYYGTLEQLVYNGTQVPLGVITTPGDFSVVLTDLLSNTTYFVAPYVISGEVGVVGTPQIFQTYPNEPTVTTGMVSNIYANSVTGTGTIVNTGISALLHHGFCWNTTGNPTIADQSVDLGSTGTTGQFTQAITGLQRNTRYYLRAYATNSGGTGYGEVVSFDTLPIQPVQPAGSGQNFDPYLISSLANLFWLTMTPAAWGANVAQTVDIDAAETQTWLCGGWPPIARQGVPENTDGFTGHYEGNGYVVKNLFVDWPLARAGLFASVDCGSINNLGVIDAIVHGDDWSVGILVGNNHGSLDKCFTTGVVSGVSNVGGLAGGNMSGLITGCFSTAEVIGTESGFCGGLVGLNGSMYLNIVADSYATGSVTPNAYGMGGLIGGSNSASSSCYRSYSTTVMEPGSNGGFMGMNEGNDCTDSFWDTEVSGTLNSATGQGRTTLEMQTMSTYSNASWEIAAHTNEQYTSSVWVHYPGQYPVLRWQLARGAVADRTVDVTSLDFGHVIAGNTQTRSFVLGNAGQIPLVGYIELPCGYTMADSIYAFDIAAGSSRTFTVIFSPDSIADFSGSITIRDNDLQDSPLVMNISGTGTSDQLPAPSNLTIAVTSSEISLTWSSVVGAVAYKVYSSDRADGDFVENTSGIFSGTSWTAPLPDERTFYRITATDTPGGSPIAPAIDRRLRTKDTR